MRVIPDFMRDYPVIYISTKYGFSIAKNNSNSLYLFKHGMYLADCSNQETLDKKHKSYDDWYLAVRKKDLEKLISFQHRIDELKNEMDDINWIHYF